MSAAFERDPLEGVDGLACDLDGVVYRGMSPIEGAVESLGRLRAKGMRVVFCTNNSALTPEAYAEKLTRIGVLVDVTDIVTSAVVVGEVLKKRDLGGKTALVVGGEGVRRAVGDAGLNLASGPDEVADVVVVGRDKSFDFNMLDRTARFVRNGAPLIATNDDATYPAEDGEEPGAGALVAAIEVAAGRRAEVVGKPHRPMMEVIARRFAPAARLAMVGDRPETDLDGARAMGWMTILVLSGVTDEKQARRLDPPADLVVDDLAALTGPV